MTKLTELTEMTEMAIMTEMTEMAIMTVMTEMSATNNNLFNSRTASDMLAVKNRQRQKMKNLIKIQEFEEPKNT